MLESEINQSMKIEISFLEVADLAAVDGLMKRDRQTLGFLPAEALSYYLDRSGVLGAKSDDRLVGYLLFQSNSRRFRITHLCVSEQFRGRGIAKKLLQALKDSATTQTAISLHCRQDFAVTSFWEHLDFVYAGEKPGRSQEGSVLFHWHLALHSDHQPELELFKAQTSDEALDVIIDAQVFFDLLKTESGEAENSKALLADFLVDSLNLCVTDELRNEIGRSDDPEQRKVGLEKIQRFPQVLPRPDTVEVFAKRLRAVLPSKTPSQQSDIRHLAKAAASDVKVFVTRDQSLLNKAQALGELANLQVLSPTELIVQVHQLSDAQSYSPDRVAGLHFGWHRFGKEDFRGFPYNAFLNKGERQREFKRNLDHFLENPDQYSCQLLKDVDDIAIVRTTRNESPGVIKVPLARVANSPNKDLFGKFLVADTLAKAVETKQDVVEIRASAISPYLIPDLLEMGFTPSADGYIKFCFSGCLTRPDALKRIGRLSPESRSSYEEMSDLELEEHCSPLSLGAEQSYFLIPIKPAYALHLFDRQRSANDLFGADITVLLRWRNVYYRPKTLYKMLRPPARILWYISDQSQVIAVSRLDDVTTAIPRELFRRFKRYGVLEWEQLFKMCNRKTSTELMALQFSHTFLFRERIPLRKIRAIYSDFGRNVSVQTVTRVPQEIFQRLVQTGYTDS